MTDVRSFYAALGIELADWAREEAPVSCFADPEAHTHEDRNRSCSVNLDSGAWNCHGCGAGGGAYDAALARGHSPRSAIELMIDHGLAEPRHPEAGRSASARAPRAARPSTPRPRRPRRRFAGSERELRDCQRALLASPELLDRLAAERLWSASAIAACELGLDQRQRITMPLRGQSGALCGVLRYDPWGRGPKMLADPGSRLQLMPHPALHGELEAVLLCEGPPDMIAARSRGLTALAVPGANAWRGAWAPELSGAHVRIVMDADRPGRLAARRILSDLQRAGVAAAIRDLAPLRADGYDLTDWLRERPHAQSRSLLARLSPRAGAASGGDLRSSAVQLEQATRVPYAPARDAGAIPPNAMHLGAAGLGGAKEAMCRTS